MYFPDSKPSIFWLFFASIALLLLVLSLSARWSELEYETRNIQGWQVKINRQLWQEKQLAKEAIALLKSRLQNIERVMPSKHHHFLKSVAIWVEKVTQGFSGLVYHPSAEWLRKHGYNPDKGQAIEVANVRNFILRSETQPWHVLHELSHAYHDRAITKDFRPIIDAYNHAISSGLYKQVPRNHGNKLRDAYALKNKSEYFAELSEAYFGENDFFPFNKQELEQYDPQGYKAIEEAWQLD